MLKAVLNALCLTVLFMLCAFGQASACSDAGIGPQEHSYVITRNSTVVLAMEYRSDGDGHGIRHGASIVAEVGDAKEYEMQLEPSTLQHNKRYISDLHIGRSEVIAQRSAMLTTSIIPAYLAAALPAFVRFQVFRI